jgi:N-acetylneuraminate synthase
MNNPSIIIDGTPIGIDYPPYVIAEMSANHNGSIDKAFRIIEEAKKSSASAVKIQTYLPQTITLDCQTDDFKIFGGLWDGRTLFELYKEAHMPWEWHKPLFDYARNLGITIFSSPFDKTAIDFLEDLNAPAYKIASFEAVDLPFIKYAASTGKPLIISTGMADADEIYEAVDAARIGGCRELAILHCVSGYPAQANEYNLRTIPDIIKRFGYVTGLSDHTLDNTTAIAAIALGASIVEKHFTLDCMGGGPDDTFSLEPLGMTALCKDARTAWQSVGIVDYGRKPSELGNVKFRRSLYFVKAIKKGEIITVEAVRSVRPGFGIAPKHIDKIIGTRAKVDIKINTPVSFDYLEI